MGEGLLIGAENLRPDLVFRKGNEINIFDVTVPLDNSLEDLMKL